MAEERKGKRIREASLPSLVSDHQIPAKLKSVERERQRRSRGELKEAERGREVQERIEDVAADSFTPDVVERLIDEAQASAFGHTGEMDGAATVPSQSFHRRLQKVIQEFKTANLVTTFKGLGGWLWQMLKICRSEHCCRPTPTTGKPGMFPLPVASCQTHFPNSPEFLQATAAGLNDLHGDPEPSGIAPNPSSLRGLKNVAETLEGAAVLDQELPKMDFGEFLKHRKIDYRGEEIKVARDISWDSVSLSLPDEVGRLHLTDFCDAGIRYFVDNFTELMIPIDEQTIGKTPRVMVQPSEWPRVAEGLVAKGICTVLRESEIHHVQGFPLLSGMFAISKQEFKGSVEVCSRLIMNLKPLNANSRSLVGDTGTLPSATSLGAMFLDDNQQIVTCSEDIRCFFYLFRVPEAWLPFLGFGLAAPPNVTPESFGNEKGFLCSRVLPMGYLNSVGIAQAIHRNVVRACMGELRPPLGGELELRRDKVFSQADQVFRVYLDNFDLVTKCSPDVAKFIEGTPGSVVLGLREAYEEKGLPRHPKKGVENQLSAEIQGAWLDGRKGTLCARPSKIMKYVALALDVLERGACTQRELQVIGGGFVYIAMFKRPLLSALNHIWSQITDMEGRPLQERWSVRPVVALEMVRFLCLIPLASMNLRLKFDHMVTASDASTQGGGICMSTGLSPYGGAAASAAVRGEIPEEHDFSQILSIGLFDGMAALRVALDVLQLPIAGHISVEQSPLAQRVVEAAFPDTILVDKVEDVDREMCQSWALRFS